MGEEVHALKIIAPDCFTSYGVEHCGRGKYCSINNVYEQVQTDLALLSPQQKEEDEGKRNPNNTCDQDMTEESHQQNRKRKRNEEEEDERRNPNFNTSDSDDSDDSDEEDEEDMIKTKQGSWDMSIKEGDKFDIPTLLSSSSRDYLIKNNGDKVQIKDHFTGKCVVLYFWNLCDDYPLPHEGNMCLHDDTKEIYREFNPSGLFEVVFIALGNNPKAFNEAFSVMPWLAIPHEDQKSRDMIEEKFAMKFLPMARSVFLDVEGTVLLHDCESCFRLYGAEGFPFTRKRFVEMAKGVIALRDELISSTKFPLKELLGEFVCSSEGQRVNTSDLENYTVGLHFYVRSPLGDPWITLLLETWKLLKDDPDKKFAIVSINRGSISLSYFKENFGEDYKDIPWYTLPYDARKLCRVLHIPLESNDISSNAGNLIIIERDRYQPLNYFALDVLEIYGIGAFPFTLERAVELEKKKQQKMQLCELLSPKTSLRRGCSTRSEEGTTVSKLVGENVLLLFATKSCFGSGSGSGSGSFLSEVKRMYHEKKGTNGHFEIIYVSLDRDESQTDFSSGIQMPWLVYSFAPEVFAVDLVEKVFGFTRLPRLPAIAAFGRDGNLQTKESNLLFKEVWCSEYPFIQADMDDEVRKELIYRYGWDLEEIFPELTFPELAAAE